MQQMIEVMGWSGEKLRLITEDVGGAFGMKTPAYPEYPALLVAARTVGRPVHWMSTRSEAFQSDNQARDTFTEAELALDEGRPHPGAARQAHRERGRTAVGGRRADFDRELRPLPADGLCDSEDRRGGGLRLHQHGADRALSRRRAARGELHDGAADR